MAEYKKVYRHDAFVRLTHFLHLVGMFLLIWSGFRILYPGSASFFFGGATMGVARKVHFYAMYLLIFPWVFRYLYHIWVSGQIMETVVRPRDIGYLPAFLKYYLFIDKKKPWGHEYNPCQRMTYSVWPILVAVQAITGFAIYWPEKIPSVVAFCGGLLMLKFWHTMIAWVFVITLMIHAYLGSTGSSLADSYVSMITGYEKQKKIV
jgi:Ni/Fe-hydrogenase b-type cytochrome subunit